MEDNVTDYFKCKQCNWIGLLKEENSKCQGCGDIRYLIKEQAKPNQSYDIEGNIPL